MEAKNQSWWRNVLVPAILVGMEAVVLAGAWLPGNWPRDFCWVVTYASSLLLLIALTVWLWFFSALRRKTRLGVSLLALGLLASLCAVFQLEGFDGDLGPIVRFRSWSPTPLLQQQLVVRPSRPLAWESSPRDWPGFLGPRRDGTLLGVKLLAGREDSPPERVWAVPLGKGWSSFAVVGQLAITQEMLGQQEYVTCLALEDGRVLWRSPHAPLEEKASQAFRSRLGGDGPRATPTVAQGRVYAYSSRGVLSCFDVSTGKRLWHRPVLLPYGDQPPRWGCASSPLVVDDLVVVGGGGGRSPALLAFRAQDGKPIWQAGPPGSNSDCYDSPVLATVCGKRQILYVSDNQVAGYDPATGQELWSHPWPRAAAQHPKVPQVLVVDQHRLVISAGYDSGVALLQLQQDERGNLQARLLWKNRNLKPKFTNPVVFQDHLFGLDMGILTCVELKSGRRRWKRGRFGHGQLLLVGDVLLIQAEAGGVALVRADPRRFRLLARWPALADKTWNVPALAGRWLLVRNDRQGMCFRLDVQPLAPEAPLRGSDPTPSAGQ